MPGFTNFERCKDDWWNEAPFQTSQTTTPSTPQNLNALPPPPNQPSQAAAAKVVDELREGKLSDKNHRCTAAMWKGCALSTLEKRSRQRVVDGPYDPRLREAKFLNATIVVSNNDAKYQINKDHAKAYARDAQTPLHWSVAQDKAGAEALHTQDCDKEAKIRWLQYHDMDTEGLCGMLPWPSDCAWP